MEITKKKVVKSIYYYKNIQDIFEYGEAPFGEKAALSFFEELLINTQNLESHYLLHPECRHLETKSKKYRNIVFGSYLII
jgi:plasmid stabilization system protein ParE